MAASKLHYKRVHFEDTMSLDSMDSIESGREQRQSSAPTVLLSLTTVFFAVLSVYLSVHPSHNCASGTVGNGFLTEWGPAKQSIEMEAVTYTSALRYNESSQAYYREYDASLPQYVGQPGPAIDNSWHRLLEGQYLAITEEEASQLDDPVSIKGYYIAEVEVMHSLHCLNAIRKALHPDHYANDLHSLPRGVQELHIDHCIEQLRQNIQCAGDLTPVMLRPWGEEPNVTLIGTPQAHTCRSWDKFRRWYTKRGDKYGKIGPFG